MHPTAGASLELQFAWGAILADDAPLVSAKRRRPVSAFFTARAAAAPAGRADHA